MTAVALMALGAKADGQKAVRHWAVEPMSDVQRLPDAAPKDGVPEGVVRITMAKNEYEPGSFVVQSPDRDLGKVRFELGEFKRVSGSGSQGEVVFPKKNLDLKFVKVWYQNLNGWYCYFGDTGDMKLVPELLVNDEDLIRVDVAKKANYARLTEKDGKTHEQWINPPRQLERVPGNGDTKMFKPMRENFKDAKTLQPVALAKGEYKQFFLTVHAEPNTPEGVYAGAVRLTTDGQSTIAEIPVEICVLPFELPRPKTLARPDEDYVNCSYSYINFDLISQWGSESHELMLKQYEAILRDQAIHGQDMHWLRSALYSSNSNEVYEALWTLDAMKRAGMRSDILVAPGATTMRLWGRPKDAKPYTHHDFYTNACDIVKAYDRTIGHHNVYVGFGDEPGPGWLRDNRPLFEGCQDAGLKFILAGWNAISDVNPHAMDWQNMGTFPEEEGAGRIAKKWNALGKKCAWYGMLHVGPENPVTNRRQYGLVPYFNGISANCNYAHHLGPYNDDSTTYRPMIFAYGTGDGVLDTIQWEGFREGIDDIRYASLAKAMAESAKDAKDGETRRTALKAIAYLMDVQADKDDLSAVRARCVDYILALKAKGVAVPKDKPLVACKDFKVPARPQPTEKKRDPLGYQTWEYGLGCHYQNLFGRRQFAEAWECFTNRTERRRATGAAELRYGVIASYGAGHPETVKGIVTLVTTNSVAYKTNDVYQIRFLADALAVKSGRKDTLAKLQAIDAKYAVAGVDGKTRLAAAETAGAAALMREDEALARALWDLRNGYLRQEPRKHYAVTWSDRPILGPETWELLAVEETYFDRKYEGSLEFLVTDVSTGNRGVDASNAQGETKSQLSFACVADDWGLHFRFTDRNPDAEAIELCDKQDGCYEMYIAPSIMSPHSCFIWDVAAERQSGSWNCGYNHAGYRRIDKKDPMLMKSRNVFRGDRIEGFLDLAWANWYAFIPSADKAEFEFEAMRWGKHSGAWNGTKSIHGRSTWGRLDLSLTAEQRAKIWKRLVLWAKNRSAWKGAANYWKDDELGDADFYAAVVKPRVDALDERLKDVSAAMDPMTALGIGPQLVRDLVDFKYDLDAARTRYVAEKRSGVR